MSDNYGRYNQIREILEVHFGAFKEEILDTAAWALTDKCSTPLTGRWKEVSFAEQNSIFDLRDFLPILKPKKPNVDKYKNTIVLIPEANGYKAYTLFVDKWVCIYEVVEEEEVEAQDDK